jgi:transposase-like protein
MSLRIDDEVLRQAVQAVNDAGGNIAEAARRAGLPETTMKSYVKRAKERLGIEPVGKPSPFSPSAAVSSRVETVRNMGRGSDNRMGLRVSAPAIIRERDDNSYRVVARGDAHDGPHLPDKSRFFHSGRTARNWGCDRFVGMGDAGDFHSLCGHVKDDTLKGRLKASFLADIESLQAAMDAERQGLGHDIPKDEAEGNHDGGRIDTQEDNNPSADGLYRKTFNQVWQLTGVTNHPYRVPLRIEGVDFVHIPMNPMGKPYGGKFSARTVAINAIRDMVIGHCHRHADHPEPKVFGELVRVIETGTTLPTGYMADYHKHSAGGWAYGLTLLKIKDGRIAGTEFKPMHEVMRET